MNRYLIPADTKKGNLILGLFKPFDVILFGTGILITVILLASGIPLNSLLVTLLVLSPALITGLLVMPIPYYHNVLTVIQELFHFFTNRQKFYWKGWCVLDEEAEKPNSN